MPIIFCTGPFREWETVGIFPTGAYTDLAQSRSFMDRGHKGKFDGLQLVMEVALTRYMKTQRAQKEIQLRTFPTLRKKLVSKGLPKG